MSLFLKSFIKVFSLVYSLVLFKIGSATCAFINIGIPMFMQKFNSGLKMLKSDIFSKNRCITFVCYCRNE